MRSMESAVTDSKYFLSREAHLCISGDQIVFLDLKSGNYLGLTAAQAAALCGRIVGWPVRETSLVLNDNMAAESVKLLLQNELLTPVPSLGKRASPTAMAVVDDDISVYFSDQPPRIHLRHVLAFAKALSFALVASRWIPLRHIVRRIVQRKVKHVVERGAPDPVSASALISIYNRLRLFTFSARDACFLDSLTLVEFLSHFRLFPEWVFGVQTSPFAAHCWVQKSSTALNDTANHVRQFTPIMSA